MSENKGRYFQKEWFHHHNWLWYHQEKRAAFCGECTLFRQPHDYSPFIFSDKAEGFKNWKKGKERIEEHERSEQHRSAAKESKKDQPDVACQIDSERRKQQQLRQTGLVAHLDTMKTLLRQGLAIRGHQDEESNIAQFNRDKAKSNPGLKMLISEKYFSHDILNEQERLIVLNARRTLVEEINSNNFFSIICDEASDISKLEQLSFSVRTCNNSYETTENFIGVLSCDQGLTSDALLKYIHDIMLRCNMDTKKLVGTAFDGASSMTRLAALMKEKFGDNIIHIHCFAHCNELVFKDATKLSPLIAEAQDLCEDLYVLVGVSPKRVLLFENIQKEIANSSESFSEILKLKNLSRTRWTTRGSAAAVLIKKTPELQEALEILSKDLSITPECRAKSRGLLGKVRSVRPMFQVVVMHELANLLENNSKNLQSASLTAEQAVYSIKKLQVRLQEIRSEEEFQRLYEQTMKLAELREEHETQKSKRQRKAPCRLSEYVAHSSSPSSATEMNITTELLRIYYEAVDAVVEALQGRFRQEDLEILEAIESCLLAAANKKNSSEEVRPQLKSLPAVINTDILEEQLKELPVVLKLYNAEHALPIKTVTTLSTLCEILNSRKSIKECLSEVHKLLTFYMSVPISSATAERTFSTMRRIKSWLRSTMSENTLNNRMFAAIHKGRIDEINSENIAKEFIVANEQRRRYFGKC
ncbi:zinc finger MYM-type protein 1-like [Dendronephthya gigantea]|uniref:zinc finger MYM-type protein 1-like n=1 Tax=Dendronephthya gigantea TaxID=151771 RepID=UPI00106CF842|nr:zinc finger MYM-type protein 1-like [Dendronephthya gigantea]XP_028414771.1 zinc finger MYM-type protein 1-like [Dendronephthya gigantea]